jgi:uncharacterized membrane protein YoaK (UPF0700 family)
MKKFRKIGELMLMVLFTAVVMTVSAVIVLFMYRFTPHLMPFITTICLGAVLLNVIADAVEQPSASVTVEIHKIKADGKESDNKEIGDRDDR